jgi:hypothetical protein
VTRSAPGVGPEHLLWAGVVDGLRSPLKHNPIAVLAAYHQLVAGSETPGTARTTHRRSHERAADDVELAAHFLAFGTHMQHRSATTNPSRSLHLESQFTIGSSRLYHSIAAAASTPLMRLGIHQGSPQCRRSMPRLCSKPAVLTESAIDRMANQSVESRHTAPHTGVIGRQLARPMYLARIPRPTALGDRAEYRELFAAIAVALQCGTLTLIRLLVVIIGALVDRTGTRTGRAPQPQTV